MKKLYLLFFSFFIILHTHSIFSQEKATGPVIEEYGPVYKVVNPDFKVDTSTELKVVFDVMNSPDDKGSINASIETAARFFNMHAQAGIPLNQLHAALVVHNKAAKDIMTNEAYREKYQRDNPNLKLINLLIDSGVQVVFCGQSAAARGVSKEEMIPRVQVSLSAMTALIQLQNQNYRLIKF
ncbi:intracellular sulfur oxidation DsrE/DsrF family protein [Saonia flava]|uniref:Intracellular sulfur oxidation DsrE/DsrF family protein n=1 Tax=Saonia flava TaxID=523696 RepID=A0A846QS77_9FLAO|nr:DsrE family protein [Saonia flava]NJB70057.1 intracellular sulfur oxidation DsrE/DsrF family protein [Saonia flava]